MVMKALTFQLHLVGPYGLFSDQSGRFIVGREVNVSSQSSEASRLISSSPRFSSTCEFYSSGVGFIANEGDVPLLEVKEYVEVEEIDFSYDNVYSGEAGPLTLAGGIFDSLMLVFGGWRDFYREVRRSGGGMDLAWDEDGIDYERIIDFTIRLRMTGGVAERLIKSEGYRLW